MPVTLKIICAQWEIKTKKVQSFNYRITILIIKGVMMTHIGVLQSKTKLSINRLQFTW